jgi:hypothetical protein
MVRAEVIVEVGPTNIIRGDAVGARDITVSNDLFAVAIAVDTAPPWGVARGGIVDIAIVRDGEPGFDVASLADFMPNNWSSWPTTYQRITVEKQSSTEVIIKTSRDFGDVDLETYFHIRDGDSRIHITTQMTNNGGAVLKGLLSGYVVWPDGGHLIAEPVTTSGDEKKTSGGWTAAYDENWLLGLHAPFSDRALRIGRDRYRQHDLKIGETRMFEAWLQIESHGSTAALVQTEIEFSQLPSGRIFGRVESDDGESVGKPAIVVSKGGEPLAWAVGGDGRYELSLPVGDFELYATARGYARGEAKSIKVSNGSETEVNFDDVRPPGSLKFKVSDAGTGQPLDARIDIREGYKPLIGYFGANTFFTELAPVGETTVDIAPGDYVFEVSAGGGFTSRPQLIEVAVNAGQIDNVEADISVLATPRDSGWYSADLHHHSDVLDGYTEAEYVMRSELAAGVDIAFLSDHDSVINNEEMHELSHQRGVPFIPATELSPSWGHFNAYPLDAGKAVGIDTGQAPVQEIFQEARRLGADVIAVNHAYSEYGFFRNHELGVVPGDFDAGFDLVEIQPVMDSYGELTENSATIQRVWQLWTDGRRAYLVAGSDVHDVWNFVSGSARSYVQVDGEFSVEKFIAALKAGQSYASQGPLVFPEILFGSDIHQSAGEALSLRYSVQAVSGLKSAQLIERGEVVASTSMNGEREAVPVEFSVIPSGDTWYSVVVEDMNGKSAYTNPVWVAVEE